MLQKNFQFFSEKKKNYLVGLELFEKKRKRKKK